MCRPSKWLWPLLLNCFLFSLLLCLRGRTKQSSHLGAPGRHDPSSRRSTRRRTSSRSSESVRRLGEGSSGALAGIARQDGYRVLEGDEQASSSLPDGHLDTQEAVGRVHKTALPGRPVTYIPGDGRGGQLTNAALVVLCFNRVAYLDRTLASLTRLAGLEAVSVYVSEDGTAPDVAAVARHYGARGLGPPASRGFELLQHPRVPQLGEHQPGHAYVAQHYKWALDRIFTEQGHSHAILLEDDMEPSPDFITYFQATAVLLERDPTLWCVSSWNDHGTPDFDWSTQRLMRTSYFPGLGWMLRRELWDELAAKFPLQSWDHYMRLNSSSRGRECIVPEVSRNRNIGERGVNMEASTYHKYFAALQAAQAPVADFGDLSYLLLDSYSAEQQRLVDGAELWSSSLHGLHPVPRQTYLVPYAIEQYADLVNPLGIWPFPRGHHRHMARLPWRGATLLLADRRLCPFLMPEERLHPSKSMRAAPAQRAGDDCISTCMGLGMTCCPQDFWFVNTCESLRQHFKCEGGCTVELGADVPAYVPQHPALPTSQACLVNQEQAHCSASHAATIRLCPCCDK